MVQQNTAQNIVSSKNLSSNLDSAHIISIYSHNSINCYSRIISNEIHKG